MKVLIAIMSVLVLFTACDTNRKKAVAAGVQYTCPMHPQIIKDEPGECPICHMDLVSMQTGATDTVSKQETKMDSTAQEDIRMDKVLPNEIELSAQQIRLANIQTDTIGDAGFDNSMVLTGTITFNEKNIEAISSRVKGRIDRLYYKNVGDFIPKGAKVYELYSEELNSAKQEYILLLQRSRTIRNTVINFNQLIEATRQKLILWGMTPAQVNALAQKRKAPYTTPFYSQSGGYITELNVTEGGYVMEGQSMIRIANTSSVWVETQAYTTQFAQLNRQGTVTVQIPQLNKRLTGTIEFTSPEINPQTRINLLRVSVPNSGKQLKPGMAAYIHLNNSQSTSLALPIDAIIRNGNMAHVWIKTGTNKFRMQMVTTGAESGGRIEVKSGLKAGDAVVVSGAYLLNSEYLLRNGVSSMEGMNM